MTQPNNDNSIALSASDKASVSSRKVLVAAITIGIALFLSFVLFHHQASGWSVNSRFCLAMAMVDKGSFCIDDYANLRSMQTDDVASFHGHLYSDKAIGVSLMAAVPLFVLRGIETVLQTHFSISTLRYCVTIFVSALSGALTGAFLFLYLSRIIPGVTSRKSLHGAIFVSVAIMLGTQYFGHSTLLVSYAPAAMFLAAAMLVMQTGLNRDSFSWRRAFFCGLLLGLSVLCETLWGIAALGIVAVIAWHNRKLVCKILPSLFLGMFLGILPFILYSFSIFGTFTIPYEYERNEMFRTAMAQGFMGAGMPNFKVLAYLTVLPYRGIFFHSPFLLLTIPGVFLLWKYKGHRSLVVMLVLVSVFYFLFNSAYYMWWGGWSFSPRHLAMLPILMAAPLYAFYIKNKQCSLAMLTLMIPAIIIHFVVVCTDPQWPDTNSFTTLEMLLSPDNLYQLKWVWYGGMFKSLLTGHAQGTIFGAAGTIVIIVLIWIAAKTCILNKC